MTFRTLLVAVALATSLSACGGSDDKGDDLPSLSTPSPTKSTTGTLLDNVPAAAPERPDDTRSKAGAFAFGSYVNDMVFYVLATNDVDALYGIADRKLCRTCAKVQSAIEKRPDRVQVEDGEHKVSAPRLVSQEGGFYTVRQRVTYPRGAEINRRTGKVHEKLGTQVQVMNINMHWRDGAWTLLDYTVDDEKD